MNEKEKKKAHPFAGHLRPTEEVLWISDYSNRKPEKLQVKIWVAMLLGVVALLVSPVIGTPNTPVFEVIAIILTLTVLAAIPLGTIALIIVVYRWLRGSNGPEHIYAVTNERLLYRSKKGVIDIPLEAVPPVSLFLSEEPPHALSFDAVFPPPPSRTKGTLSFGAFFPMWPDVDDAAEVKRLIDDAQKKRTKEMPA